MTVPEEVRQHYAENEEGSRISEGPGQLEFVRVREIVRGHLPPGRSRIADIGGGTGVHAAWLADEGHDVYLIDPAPNHVEAAQQLRPTAGAIHAQQGEASSLPFGDESMDAALVFGPLYHLLTYDDRVQALREARRVVRQGGLVFIAGISRFASLFDGLRRGFLLDDSFREIVERDLREGQHRNPTNQPHWFTTAYFHHPSELRDEAVAAELEVIDLLGVEGLALWLPQLADEWNDENHRAAILFAARVVENEP